jgi:hypothetical protein
MAGNTFEDLSGISTSTFSNPYEALIAACNDDTVCILNCICTAGVDRTPGTNPGKVQPAPLYTECSTEGQAAR